MMYVSSTPSQSLSDFAEVVYQAFKHEKPNTIFQFNENYFKVAAGSEEDGDLHIHLKGKTHHICSFGNGLHSSSTPLHSSDILALFLKYAQLASTSHEKHDQALDILEKRLSAQFKEKKINKILGFSFEGSDLYRQIETIRTLLSQKMRGGPSLSAQTTDVFTDDLQNGMAYGALENYSYGNYVVKWMTPRQFIKINTLFFQEMLNETRILYFQKIMLNLPVAGADVSSRFAPLMIRLKLLACGDYAISEMEGLHRAEAARRLSLPTIPVAVRVS